MLTPPKGLRDALPDEAEPSFFLASRLVPHLVKRGYRMVRTPLLEYLETFSASGEPALDERTLKLIEWETGKIMALRTDFTPPIARLAASLTDGRKPPLRFSYCGPVLKFDLRKSTKKREELQLGAELIGRGGVQGDREIIEICVSLLRHAGLKRFVVQVGDVRFLHSVARGASARSLRKKEWPALHLGGLAAGPGGTRPVLEGSPAVLARLARSVRDRRARAALTGLRQSLRAILRDRKGFRVHVDLGEVRDLHYYTGLFFQVFHPDTTDPVATGGRYDGLVKKFGRDLPATGFAVDLALLSQLVGRTKRESRGGRWEAVGKREALHASHLTPLTSRLSR